MKLKNVLKLAGRLYSGVASPPFASRMITINRAARLDPVKVVCFELFGIMGDLLCASRTVIPLVTGTLAHWCETWAFKVEPLTQRGDFHKRESIQTSTFGVTGGCATPAESQETFNAKPSSISRHLQESGEVLGF